MDFNSHPVFCSCYSCIGRPCNTLYINAYDLLTHLPLDSSEHTATITTEPLKFSHKAFGPDHPNWPKELSLQTIPSELYQSILSKLSIQDLTSVRRLSQYTRETINSIFEYGEVLKYAPMVLRACLATGAAKEISLGQIHWALTHSECDVCGVEYGGNFSLFLGTRVCGFCLRNNPTLQPIEYESLLQLATSPNSIVNLLFPTIKTIKTLPGTYAIGTSRQPISPCHLFLLSQIPQDASTLLLTPSQLTHLSTIPEETPENRTAIKHNPYVHDACESHIDLKDGRLGNGDPHFGRWPQTSTTLSYTTSITMPFLYSKIKVIDHGAQCRHCLMALRYLEWQHDGIFKRNNSFWTPGNARTYCDDATRDMVNSAREKAAVLYLGEKHWSHYREKHEGWVLTKEFAEFCDWVEGLLVEDVLRGGDGELGLLVLPSN